jgi:hypothetical protein
MGMSLTRRFSPGKEASAKRLSVGLDAKCSSQASKSLQLRAANGKLYFREVREEDRRLPFGMHHSKWIEVDTMWNRRWIFVAALVACGWLTAQIATPLAAQQKDKASTSDKNADAEKELDVRYAKAYLRLMEATLEKYQETNRKLPNTIRPSVMQAIQEGVREARERVQLAEHDDMSDAEIYVSSAEADLRSAEEALRKAEGANLQFSGTISQAEIERLKADIDLAKIKLEKARHLASESPLSNVRYELEQLREDVAELRMFVALLRDRN